MVGCVQCVQCVRCVLCVIAVFSLGCSYLPAGRERARVEEILRAELLRHPRFRALLEAQPVLEIESTSFQPYVTTKVCGDNWFMVGEAAAMPDPLTGNGVTSGIRHARHAADFRFRRQGA